MTDWRKMRCNEAEAESFSRFCVEDIRHELEEKGYRIKKNNCTAEDMDMDMEWLDRPEDLVFPRGPSQ